MTALRAEGCGGALWAHIEKRGAAGTDIKKGAEGGSQSRAEPGQPRAQARRLLEPGHHRCLNPLVYGNTAHYPTREALIKSLSDFILAFLFNARNKSTRIASYLRRLMTQHWIKIHMKFDSAN